MLLAVRVLACGTPVEHSKAEGCFRLMPVVLLLSWVVVLTILLVSTKWCMCFLEKFMQLCGVFSTIGLILGIIFYKHLPVDAVYCLLLVVRLY